MSVREISFEELLAILRTTPRVKDEARRIAANIAKLRNFCGVGNDVTHN